MRWFPFLIQAIYEHHHFRLFASVWCCYHHSSPLASQAFLLANTPQDYRRTLPRRVSIFPAKHHRNIGWIRVDRWRFLIVDTVTNNFRYSRIFAEIPSNQTDEAWKHLFPPHGGFFTHPAAPHQRSTLSVFHQLHCLVRLNIVPFLNYFNADRGH